MTKWRAVHNALLRANRGKLKRSYHVREHNAPKYQEVYNHFNNAFMNDNHEWTQGGTSPIGVRLYFNFYPNKRQHITMAYNKLNNMARELAGIRRKVIAATSLQRRWRAVRQEVMNKRKAASLITMRTLPILREHQREIFEKAFPKPVYGPVTELKHLQSYNKYRRY